MKRKIVKGLILAVGCVAVVASNAFAVPVTVTYTADNVVDTFWLQNGSVVDDLAAGSNRSDWTSADSETIDLDYGSDYSFIWNVRQEGTFTNSNPAAFLGQIEVGGENFVYSSKDWFYAIDPSNGTTSTSDFETGWTWLSVTEYGTNGGSNIWTTVNSGAVAGIGAEAQWVWSDTNFLGGTDYNIFIRADFTPAPVPEPTTMLLFGTGLIGLAGIARRRTHKKDQ